jgi:uncharacterized membrane protein YfcA
MDLTLILAALVDKFKVQSPQLFAIISLVLGVFLYTVNEGQALWLWEVDGPMQKALEVIAFVLAALTGSRTTRYVEPSKKR